jgi:CII-binding regulator of phage lambda lysogenization HflD
MNDEFVIEHLILAILVLKVELQILKDQGVTEKLKSAIDELEQQLQHQPRDV